MPPWVEVPRKGVAESRQAQVHTWLSNNPITEYLLYARYIAQTIPFNPHKNPVRWVSFSYLTDARWPTRNPTASEKQSRDLNLGLPVSKPRPFFYLSSLCLFLGKSRKRSRAILGPLVLRAGSVPALVHPPCRQSKGQQTDKSVRVGTAAKGRRGAGRPAGRGQHLGQTSWGLLARQATLRKPNHIRPQEFPGPVHTQKQPEKT